MRSRSLTSAEGIDKKHGEKGAPVQIWLLDRSDPGRKQAVALHYMRARIHRFQRSRRKSKSVTWNVRHKKEGEDESEGGGNERKERTDKPWRGNRIMPRRGP